MDKHFLARVAYDAYCNARNWKSVRGEQLPQFDQQDPGLQEAWAAAAEAVRLHLANQDRPGGTL